VALELGQRRKEAGHLQSATLSRVSGVAALGAPLMAPGTALAALVLVPELAAPLLSEPKQFWEAFARQTALALERAQLTAITRAAAVRIQTEEMRSTLLSAVSHDLRTPLASITGAATTLRGGDNLTPTVRQELVMSVCDEAERLERLVGDLLDMTRIEAGGLQLRREIVPMEEMIGSALGRVESKLASRHVTVVAPAGVILVTVDPVLFEQVFINLLENAVKYTPTTGQLTLTTSEANGTVSVVLEDDGPGIPPGREEQVFDTGMTRATARRSPPARQADATSLASPGDTSQPGSRRAHWLA
jgi:two-component system, OmpR family, sensor histidine kinase KdpD